MHRCDAVPRHSSGDGGLEGSAQRDRIAPCVRLGLLYGLERCLELGSPADGEALRWRKRMEELQRREHGGQRSGERDET